MITPETENIPLAIAQPVSPSISSNRVTGVARMALQVCCMVSLE